jgi:DNA-binding HxlR family transcriptional regulator
MHNPQFRRSDCPISAALETIGDKWSLLIVRDIACFGKHSYCEFLASSEGIATNVLANHLRRLERDGILQKEPHPGDRRKDIYTLTEKGLDLIPVLVDLAAWSRGYGVTAGAADPWSGVDGADRAELIAAMREKVRLGQALFSASEHLPEEESNGVGILSEPC